MGYFVFKNGETTANDTTLNAMQKGLMELVFPVGSTYITQSDTNPNTILGFGTWERLKGKVCVGLDEDDEDEYFDEIGKTGGEKKHTQTVNEMASHTHDSTLNYEGQGGNQWSYRSNEDYYGGPVATTATGGGQPMNITQPYEVVGYMWIRRS